MNIFTNENKDRYPSYDEYKKEEKRGIVGREGNWKRR
jgi:hypothetical protein